MRWRTILYMTAACWVMAVVSAFGAEEPRVVKFPNGLTVMTVEDNRFPLVAIRLFVHGYSAIRTRGPCDAARVFNAVMVALWLSGLTLIGSTPQARIRADRSTGFGLAPNMVVSTPGFG